MRTRAKRREISPKCGSTRLKATIVFFFFFLPSVTIGLYKEVAQDIRLMKTKAMKNQRYQKSSVAETFFVQMRFIFC